MSLVVFTKTLFAGVLECFENIFVGVYLIVINMAKVISVTVRFYSSYSNQIFSKNSNS